MKELGKTLLEILLGITMTAIEAFTIFTCAKNLGINFELKYAIFLSIVINVLFVDLAKHLYNGLTLTIKETLENMAIKIVAYALLVFTSYIFSLILGVI